MVLIGCDGNELSFRKGERLKVDQVWTIFSCLTFFPFFCFHSVLPFCEELSLLFITLTGQFVWFSSLYSIRSAWVRWPTRSFLVRPKACVRWTIECPRMSRWFFSPRQVDYMQSRLISMHRVQDDVSIVVQLIVGQFDAVERDHRLSLPDDAFARRVGMHVQTWRCAWIGLACHNPTWTEIGFQVRRQGEAKNEFVTRKPIIVKKNTSGYLVVKKIV